MTETSSCPCASLSYPNILELANTNTSFLTQIVWSCCVFVHAQARMLVSNCDGMSSDFYTHCVRTHARTAHERARLHIVQFFKKKKFGPAPAPSAVGVVYVYVCGCTRACVLVSVRMFLCVCLPMCESPKCQFTSAYKRTFVFVSVHTFVHVCAHTGGCRFLTISPDPRVLGCTSRGQRH